MKKQAQSCLLFYISAITHDTKTSMVIANARAMATILVGLDGIFSTNFRKSGRKKFNEDKIKASQINDIGKYAMLALFLFLVVDMCAWRFLF